MLPERPGNCREPWRELGNLLDDDGEELARDRVHRSQSGNLILKLMDGRGDSERTRCGLDHGTAYQQCWVSDNNCWILLALN
jgi:hypothetical protein